VRWRQLDRKNRSGLNSYRILTDSRFDAELNSFSGRTIDVPAMFIGGARDWGYIRYRERSKKCSAERASACSGFT
jgi:hypothetical protein